MADSLGRVLLLRRRRRKAGRRCRWSIEEWKGVAVVVVVASAVGREAMPAFE
jgi:hypothetical protein